VPGRVRILEGIEADCDVHARRLARIIGSASHGESQQKVRLTRGMFGELGGICRKIPSSRFPKTDISPRRLSPPSILLPRFQRLREFPRPRGLLL
jgi:hypothetical protein